MTTSLYIDIGNTALKLALAENGVLQKARSYRHGEYRVGELLAEQLLSCPVDRLVFASVYQSSLSVAIKDWCLVNHIAVSEIKTSAQLHGLRNGYEQPLQLGVDRWLAMLAAWVQNARPFVLVSAGTAVTLDVVDLSGLHLGGLIMPGLELMQQSLLQHTVAITECAADPAFEHILQKNTAAAVSSGTVLAIAGMIEKTMHKFKSDNFDLLLTGGAAGQLSAVLDTPCTLVADLVLGGLQIADSGK
jgi:type III pantothenate kinase